MNTKHTSMWKSLLKPNISIFVRQHIAMHWVQWYDWGPFYNVGNYSFYENSDSLYRKRRLSVNDQNTINRFCVMVQFCSRQHTICIAQNNSHPFSNRTRQISVYLIRKKNQYIWKWACKIAQFHLFRLFFKKDFSFVDLHNSGKMSTRTARHEESYSSSNVVRTLHPSRPLSPPQKNVEFNNNNLGKLIFSLVLLLELYHFTNIFQIIYSMIYKRQ